MISIEQPCAASSRSKAIAVDKKVPIALVGLNFGRHIIETQLLDGPGSAFFKLSGVCDLDRKRSAEASDLFGVKAYADLDEVLADPGIAAVGLYTGPAGRANLVRKIIRAGKDVMTTKPFELDPEAALAVLAEAHELGRVVHLNSPAPVPALDIRKIFEWRQKYALGRPVGCRADVWAGYKESADGSWQDDPEKCPLAPIFRLGIYLINDLIQIFGEPEAVQAFASRLSTGRPTPDTAQLGIRFKAGGLANIFSSFCVNDGDQFRNGLVLNFENGTVYRNVGPHRSALADNGVSELSLVIRNGDSRTVVEQSQTEASGHYRWDLFHKAVRGEAIEGEMSPQEIVSGLKIVRAMYEADRSGCSVRV